MSDTRRQSSGVQPSPLLVSALPILSYCSASILMTLINKFVVSGKHFSMNFLIVAIQSATSAFSVIAMKRLGVINFRDFDMADAKRWFPVSFLLAMVIYTGSKALQYLTINVFSIFKNMTIILIAYGEVFWFGGKVTPLTFLSFFLMVMSSVIAAWADLSTAFGSFNSAWSTGDASSLKGLSTSRSGYIWMATNCFAQAGFVLMMRKKIKSTGFKDWDTTFYNNLLAVPVLTVFSFIAEDWSSKNLKTNFPEENRNFLLTTIIFSGCAAIFISYSTAWCVRVTSSTTYSMVGALNKLPVAASGMIFFGEAVTTGSVSALFTGFVAGLVYAIAKNNQKQQEAANPPDAMPMHRRA